MIDGQTNTLPENKCVQVSFRKGSDSELISVLHSKLLWQHNDMMMIVVD